MRLNHLLLLAGAVFVLGAPDTALAWGPAVHIGMARTVLDSLSILPVAVAAILARNGIAYLYGNIAADIVFAKRLSRVKQFCHHWSTAFRLLDRASSEQGRAFAYGYLSHLAADTVAHGKYVPHQIMISNCSTRFGHLYWESRADAVEKEASWRELETVLDDDHDHHHATLEPYISDTFLSYELNRLLFNHMNALAVRRTFRRTMKVLGRRSRWNLSDALMEGYRAECVERISAILREGKQSALLREDPNGTSALMHLSVRRREQRRLRRQGIPLMQRQLETSRALGPCPTNLPGIGDGPSLIPTEGATL
ncbi:MAG: zinc dependent phospholipase C family protein [Phycisphaerales bacterium]|nr:MAG: zinc dependent phospholipase C family protein [Phycisphaerales bacterium]